jgi:hypothetical protein
VAVSATYMLGVAEGECYKVVPLIPRSCWCSEEHKRRGDAADAMFREFKRLIEEAVAKERPTLPLRPIRPKGRP